MTTNVSRPLLLAATFALVAAWTPADAATITSNAFVAVVRPTAAFLARSSALAETATSSRRLRALARREAVEDTAVVRSVDAWQAADDRSTNPNSFESSLDRLSSAGKLLAIPFNVVADATAPASPPLPGLPSADAIAATADADLRYLSELRGPAFDASFVAAQRAALLRLIPVYRSFILNGDDPVLRRLAVDGLPRAERDLTALDGPAS